MAEDDGALMERAQRGDLAAFDEIFARYYDRVFAYARRVLEDEDLAVEVAQECFVRAFRSRDTFRAEAGTLRAWLFAIAANRIRRTGKKRNDAPASLEDASAFPASTESGLDAFERSWRREEVSRAIDALPVELREVIALKYLGGLTDDEVSKLLECSVGAVKMRALRGRDLLARRLRFLIESHGGEA